MPPMPGPGPLPNDDWDAALRDVIADMHGRPINVHRLLANHPDLLRAWWNFRNHSVTGGTLTPRQNEIVILLVAHAMQNAYEWDSHVDRGLAAGLDPAEIEAIRSGGGQWPAEETVLIEVVGALLDAHQIPDGLLGHAREHFSDQALMDVIFIHGAYVILGCLLNSYPVALDDEVAARLDAGGPRVAALRFHP